MADDKPQDAIELLKADHRAVEDLFKEFQDAKGSGRKEKLAREICLQLTVHTALEEEIFYPACKGKVEEDLIKESFVEHDAAKLLMAEIESGTEKSDDYFDSKVKVLQEEIEHHVKEEERMLTGFFAQARRSDLDMDALGAKMTARKEELTNAYRAKGTPEPKLTTMDEVKI